MPSPGGWQETVCLPLDLIPGFLFGIDDRRVKDDCRDVVLRYKRDCYRVLYEHFFGERVVERPHQVTDEYLDNILRFLHQHDARIHNAVIGRARAGRAHASIWELADDTGLSWENCRRGVRLLEAIGLIRVTDERGILRSPGDRKNQVIPYPSRE